MTGEPVLRGEKHLERKSPLLATGGTPVLVAQQSFIVTGLVTGFFYGFKIAAVNKVVRDNPLLDSLPVWSSTYYQFIAVTPGTPDPPVLVVGTRTISGITLKWTAPADDGGQLITGFRLYRDDGSTAVPNIIIWNGEGKRNIMEFAVTGLSPGSSYAFAVTALNAAGESTKSTNLVMMAGKGPSFTSSPYRDTSSPTSPTTIKLGWNVPENLAGQSVDLYKILRDDGNYGSFLEVGTTTSNSEMVSFGAEAPNGKFYRFVIQAENSVGWGDMSPVFRTQICGKPDAPSSIGFEDYLDDGVTVIWNPPVNGGCLTPRITKYEIYMRQGNNIYIKVYQGPPNSLRYSVSGNIF